LLSRFFAVLFVILIVLPFTAPFQTVDLFAPQGKTPTHDPFSTAKDSKNVATLARTQGNIPWSYSTAVAPEALPDTPPRLPNALTVLRL
jgi:hypothetical protein